MIKRQLGFSGFLGFLGLLGLLGFGQGQAATAPYSDGLDSSVSSRFFLSVGSLT